MIEVLRLLEAAIRMDGYVRPRAAPGYVFVVTPDGASVAFLARAPKATV